MRRPLATNATERFSEKDCYDEHLRNHPKGKNRDVVCELVKKCTKCKRTVTDLNKHVCGYTMCITPNLTATHKRTNVTRYPSKQKAVTVRGILRAMIPN